VAEFIDRAGAVCGVWQPDGHIGAVYANEPGTLIWNELLTYDTAAAAAFYCTVFGWTHAVREKPGGTYHLFKDGYELRGGMVSITPAMGDVSPSWRAYIAVADLDASLAKVVDLGGSAHGDAVEIPGMGRAAGIRDPAAVSFMLMEPTQPD
jgi:predicted enzyme related to lactoylglutathione lyase